MKFVNKQWLGLAAISLIATTSLVPTMAADTHATFPTTQSSAHSVKLAPNFDPWLQKPVLGYLFHTQDAKLTQDIKSLQSSLGLTNEQLSHLSEIGQQESYLIQNMKNDSDLQLSSAKTLAAKQHMALETNYNERVTAELKNTDAAVHQVLGAKYPAFRTWLYTWWNNERSYRQSVIQPNSTGGTGGGTYYQIYATQFNANTTYQVALPDKNLKAAGTYSVTISRNGTYTTQPVLDVGPWNEDDNYWDPSYNRRMFMTLSQYDPEAYEAYTNGYNGGLDEFNRVVTNPAGIDLSPAVATILGMGYNVSAYIQVNFVGLP